MDFNFIHDINIGLVVTIPVLVIVLAAAIAILREKHRGVKEVKEITSESICASDSKETEEIEKIEKNNTPIILKRKDLVTFHSSKHGKREGKVLEIKGFKVTLQLPSGAIVRRQRGSLKKLVR